MQAGKAAEFSKQQAFRTVAGGIGGFLSLPARLCRVLLPPSSGFCNHVNQRSRQGEQAKKKKGKRKGKLSLKPAILDYAKHMST